MNDKWDNVDANLIDTPQKSRGSVHYTTSTLIANDKLRRTINAEVGI